MPIFEYVVYYNAESKSFGVRPASMGLPKDSIVAAIIDTSYRSGPMLVWIADYASDTFPGTQQINDMIEHFMQWRVGLVEWQPKIDAPNPAKYRERK